MSKVAIKIVIKNKYKYYFYIKDEQWVVRKEYKNTNYLGFIFKWMFNIIRNLESKNILQFLRVKR